MKPLAECVLYTFVDSAYLHGRDPAALATSLCEGGSDLIQLRAKDWSLDRIEETSAAIREITRQYNAGFVINDHLEIAQRIGADFCHLGQEDFFDAGYTTVSELPKSTQFSQPAIGLSTHAPAQAERAVRAGANYIAVGPIFPTGTKPTAKAVTLEYIRWAASNVQTPWFAIGGINLANLPEVVGAGARRICVVSAILNENDVVSACREFRKALTSP